VEDFDGWIFRAEVLEVFVSGFLQPSGALGSSFDPSRFVSSGSFGHGSFDEIQSHFCALAHAQDRTFCHIPEVVNEGENFQLGASQAQAAVVYTLFCCRFEHDQAHQQFFLDHRWDFRTLFFTVSKLFETR